MGVMYMNKDTGELLTRAEMRKQFADEYDGEDPTNIFGIDEYYAEIGEYHCTYCGKSQHRMVEYLAKANGVGQCLYCGNFVNLRRVG